MSKRRISALLIALAMLLGVSPAWAQTFSVEAVKAAFLYRFASYVEWPADSPVTPFVIAVAGAEDVAKQLDELLPRMKVHGRAVEVRRVARAADLDGVHILYVGPELTSRSRSLRASGRRAARFSSSPTTHAAWMPAASSISSKPVAMCDSRSR